MEERLHFTGLKGDKGLLVGDQVGPASDHQIFIEFERIGTLHHLKLVTVTAVQNKQNIIWCIHV